MVMHEEDSDAPDGAVSPCGHRNRPSAHFCDVCGVMLPMRCPRCRATNRSQANFCSNCGIGLGDVRRSPAAPSIAPFGPSPDSSPATWSGSAPASSEPFVSSRQAANEDMDEPESLDPLPWAAERGKGRVADASEDAERLEQIEAFFQRRPRPRRAWVWLGTASVGVVIGLLGIVLVRAHIAT